MISSNSQPSSVGCQVIDSSQVENVVMHFRVEYEQGKHYSTYKNCNILNEEKLQLCDCKLSNVTFQSNIEQ